MAARGGCARVMLIASGIILTLVGLVCSAGSVLMLIAGGEAKETPRTVTLQKLLATGHGDNTHVQITDGRLLVDKAVYEEQSDGKWKSLLVPMVPATAADDVATFQVVLRADGIENEDQLRALAQQKQFRGVVGSMDISHGSVAKKFKRLYPGVAIDNCLLVAYLAPGEQPTSRWFGLLCLIPFVLLTLLGAASTWKLLHPRRSNAPWNTSPIVPAQLATGSALPPAGPGPPQPNPTTHEILPISGSRYLAEVMIHKGIIVHGLSMGNGLVILRPGYLAFIPTEKRKHLGAELLKGVAMGVSGVHTINFGANDKMTPEAWIEQLRRQPDQFDTEIVTAARGMGGVAWLWPEVEVEQKKVLFRGSKRGLWFQNHSGESVRLTSLLDSVQLAQAEALYRNARRVS
ncbi:MAG: hypothetical protein K8T25_12075 [Planctomycetia bacterium]|nr:hypothetical protein [Planctomycetia bacterium]